MMLLSAAVIRQLLTIVEIGWGRWKCGSR